MKITKSQLKQIIKEELSKTLKEQRGGYGTMTSREVEQMLNKAGWTTLGREGQASIIQKRALEKGLSRNDLATLIAGAGLLPRDTARQVFQKLGFRY